MTGGRLLQQRLGRVETEAISCGREKLGQGAAALMGRRRGPELLLDVHQHRGHFVLAVGCQVACHQSPGVDQFGLDEHRERPAPVEDDGIESHGAHFTACLQVALALRFWPPAADAVSMRTAPAAAAAGLLALALALGACGGGGQSTGTTVTTAPGPGAKVDPNSGGVVGGPVNKAKSVVTSLNQQQHQEEQQTGG